VANLWGSVPNRYHVRCCGRGRGSRGPDRQHNVCTRKDLNLHGSPRRNLVTRLKKRWMKEPSFKAGYDALQEEFTIASVLIEARVQAKLSQQQLAERMGTSQSTIARLESGTANPSISTLERIAKATGTRACISLEPTTQPRKAAKRGVIRRITTWPGTAANEARCCQPCRSHGEGKSILGLHAPARGPLQLEPRSRAQYYQKHPAYPWTRTRAGTRAWAPV